MTPEVRQAHATGRVICVDRPHTRGNGCLGGGAPRRLPAMSPSPRNIGGDGGGDGSTPPFTSTSLAMTYKTQRARTHSRTHSTSCPPEEWGDDDGIVYIYDDDGRLVEDMTVNGRAWSDRVRFETQRGGHLIKLFWYGTLTTVVAVGLVSLAFVTMEGWQLRATLFWIRTLYCLFLCPFVIFKVPMMMRLLTRTRKTGYDREGRTCVEKKRSKFDQMPTGIVPKIERGNNKTSAANANLTLKVITKSPLSGGIRTRNKITPIRRGSAYHR
tara:strand:- start:76 stop:885 length:810 start_codon:yes stop_codon:yes gene_type:complete